MTLEPQYGANIVATPAKTNVKLYR
jgi:hypothetical protein